ncbi:MAG: hypothetical protein A2452_12730 [Candidatus Firestonebacteria bacterium RIFOXYC2_FULL_39_67]|nr:MAG: hypothetical protein A2536_12095 [Candidatus Firestonebacteria bacterium RIFOXYD2_FULL_39_29]OGF52824.1 MAG: hypothetical protein A2497_00975 [Candidatus Firestonebacteria bacterium RifOxyC12_full_39_7]OGF57428.1 MAG: hypothetical protein A2452_12730 [Candidatus Firestonebacteria bacterium RIFOXYC2_FULL_39_67]
MLRKVLLVIILICTVFMKADLYEKNTSFKSSDGFCQFRTESAVRFHYAKLVSEGKRIPAVDEKAQFPEGLKVKERIKLTNEYFSGILYNFVSHETPFHVYLAYLMFIISGITIFAVYSVSNKISGLKWAAFIPVLFLVTSFSWYSRTVAGGFVEEDFALPFIFLSFLFYFLKHKDPAKKYLYPLLSGLFLFVPLTSWHMTQFFYTVFLAFIAFEYFLRYEERDDTVFPLLFIAGFNLLGGVLIPTLRAEGFLFSYSMLATYALIGSWLLDKKIKLSLFSSLGIFILLSGVLISGFSFLAGRHSGEYNHVYQLLYYKIRYFGTKPDDPSGMPFDAKVFWQAGFVSPVFSNILIHFGGLFVGAAFGIGLIISKFIKRQTSKMEEGLLFFLMAFIPLYLLFERLYVFLVFFMVPFSVLLLTVKPFKNNRVKKISIAVIIIFALGCQSYLGFTKDIKQNDAGVHRDMVSWLKNNAKEEGAILSNFGIAGQIFAYADKPVVLHPMFESADIRAKTKECYEAVYKSEEEFYALCRKYKVRYFVYEWQFIFDKTKNSVRYQINQNAVNNKSAAYNFHFYPEKLSKFSLMFQNTYYRIYKVNEPGEKVTIPARLEYYPFFNPLIFAKKDNSGNINDTYIHELMNIVWQFPQMQAKALVLRKQGKNDLAESEYKKITGADPYFPQARVSLAEYYISINKPQEAANQAASAIQLDKYYVDAYYYLSQAYFVAGQIDNAIEVLKETEKFAPEHEGIKRTLQMYQDAKKKK